MKLKHSMTKSDQSPLEPWARRSGGQPNTPAAPKREEDQEAFSRRRMESWARQAQAVEKLYPGFDLSRESQDPRFQTLLRCGVPVLTAYEVCHLSEIKAAVARDAALQRERAVTEDIRARGGRPAENGAGASNAVTARTDLERMTREDRAELARRAAGGELITLR